MIVRSGRVAGAVALASMLATPFARAGGAGRRGLTAVTVSALFTSTTATVSRRWGVGRAGTALGTVLVGTLVVEQVGVRTGRPFGSYRYTDALRPRLGGVPALVPMAWWAMAVPARETVHAALGDRSSAAGRIVGGAAALTAWDLFLDPQMTREGYWRWSPSGRYRGIPLSNYAGWFVVAIGVMTVLEIALQQPGPAHDTGPDAGLVATYLGMGVMETAAFSSFLRDPVVAVVGALGMVPVAATAAVRVGRNLVGQRL